MAKILTIDIETSPIMAKVWSLWKQNVSLDQIEDDWYIMSFAAKWLGKDGVEYHDCRNSIGKDKKLLKRLHELLDEADIVIAHNGDKFDIPKINARFILNGLQPPSPYKSIDTVKVAKRTFNFTSNKLAYLTDALCEDKKLDHAKFAGWKLWNECMLGNEEAWDEMEEYNRMDVVSLEELYLKLRPWMPNHPNVNVMEDHDDCNCPKCGSGELVKRGFHYTNKGQYQRFRCKDCGGWSSSTYTMNTIDKRKSLLASR
jgi:DNA polymerase elongation subunit (family B)